MRTTDPEPRPLGPLGEKLTPKTPSTSAPLQRPAGPSGIVTDSSGKLRTTTHPKW